MKRPVRKPRASRPLTLEPAAAALAREIDAIVEDRGVEIADVALVLAEIFDIPRGHVGAQR